MISECVIGPSQALVDNTVLDLHDRLIILYTAPSINCYERGNVFGGNDCHHLKLD